MPFGLPQFMVMASEADRQWHAIRSSAVCRLELESNGSIFKRRCEGPSSVTQSRIKATNASFLSFGTDSRWRRRRLLTEWMDIIHGGGAILRNNVIRIAEKETGGSTTYGVVPDIYQRVNVFVWTKLTSCDGKYVCVFVIFDERHLNPIRMSSLPAWKISTLFFWSTTSNRFGNPSHFKD